MSELLPFRQEGDNGGQINSERPAAWARLNRPASVGRRTDHVATRYQPRCLPQTEISLPPASVRKRTELSLELGLGSDAWRTRQGIQRRSGLSEGE
jgi:hypothetical protein